MTKKKERKSNEMWTSVSAITNATGCLRRWWFMKVVKMPTPQRAVTVFGDVGHAVWDRFYRADDRGLVNGVPVDLFPGPSGDYPGWMTMCNRFDKTKTPYTVTPEEAALIKVLIAKGISEGYAVRTPGRIVEKEINSEILRLGHAKAILRGFIDLDLPDGLEDHKFLKDKKWAKSKAKLKKDIQMMGYGYEKKLRGHTGNLWLCHNNFIKDFENPQVIKRSVEVTHAEILQFFADEIQPMVRKMLDLYIRYPKSKIALWRDIPPANNAHSECNFYYGHQCPLIGICTGTCSLDNYLRPYNLTVNLLVGETDEQKGSVKMGSKLMDRVNAEKAVVAATVPAAPVAAGTAVVAPVTTPIAVAPQPDAPVVAVTVADAPVINPVLQDLIDKNKPAVAVAVAPAEVLPLMVGNTTPTPGVVTPTTVVPSAPPAPAPAQQTAPWYTGYNGEECPACKENAVRGYGSNMSPCRICSIRSAELGRPGYETYDITTDASGLMTFTLKGSSVVPVATAALPDPAVKIEAAPAAVVEVIPVTTVAPAPLAPAGTTAMSGTVVETPVVNVPVPTVVTNTELPAADIAFPAAAIEASAAGDFILMIGCTYIRKHVDAGHRIDADALTKGMLDEIAATAGKDVSAIEHFALMQAIDAYVPTMVPDLAGVTIISLSPSKGSAQGRMIDGLRMFADTIIVPFAQ